MGNSGRGWEGRSEREWGTLFSSEGLVSQDRINYLGVVLEDITFGDGWNKCIEI